MTSQERETLVLAYLDGKLEELELAHFDEMLRRDPELASLLAELSLNEALIADADVSARGTMRHRVSTRLPDAPISPSSPMKGFLLALAAAAALVAALAWVSGLGGKAREERLIVEVRKEAPKPEVRPAPPAPAPEIPKVSHDSPDHSPAAPSSGAVPVPSPAGAPAPDLEPGKPEAHDRPAAPKPVPEPPKKEDPAPTQITKDRPAPRPVVLASPRGGLSRARAGRSDLVTEHADVQGEDVLSTGPRRGASFQIEGAAMCWLDRSTSIHVDRDDDGILRIQLVSGVVYIKTTEPATVTAPAGAVRAQAAAFQVDLDKGRLQVLVLDGTVQARSSKGEQAVRAGQRSTIRPGEKPSPAAKAEVDAATAWVKAPVLAVKPPEGPYLEREPGGNRKFSGLVFSAPYSDGEEQSGRMARVVAEAADAGLVLGHGYRDPSRRLWINVDRGMEGDVAADGTVANERFTDRARRSTAEFLDHCRAASSVAAREPVPFLFQFRTHYLKQGDTPLDVAELAWEGFNKVTMAQAKTFYVQLLDKYKPVPRLDIKVQGLDETYDWRGTRRKFSLNEDDARQEGYMSPRNSRNAVVVFMPQGFGRAPAEIEPYARIFAELAEFLSSRRR